MTPDSHYFTIWIDSVYSSEVFCTALYTIDKSRIMLLYFLDSFKHTKEETNYADCGNRCSKTSSPHTSHVLPNNQLRISLSLLKDSWEIIQREKAYKDVVSQQIHNFLPAAVLGIKECEFMDREHEKFPNETPICSTVGYNKINMNLLNRLLKIILLSR